MFHHSNSLGCFLRIDNQGYHIRTFFTCCNSDVVTTTILTNFYIRIGISSCRTELATTFLQFHSTGPGIYHTVLGGSTQREEITPAPASCFGSCIGFCTFLFSNSGTNKTYNRIGIVSDNDIFACNNRNGLLVSGSINNYLHLVRTITSDSKVLVLIRTITNLYGRIIRCFVGTNLEALTTNEFNVSRPGIYITFLSRNAK